MLQKATRTKAKRSDAVKGQVLCGALNLDVDQAIANVAAGRKKFNNVQAKPVHAGSQRKRVRH